MEVGEIFLKNSKRIIDSYYPFGADFNKEMKGGKSPGHQSCANATFFKYRARRAIDSIRKDKLR